LLSVTRRMLVAKNSAARFAVVRGKRLAVERPVMNPDMPPPPMPSAAAFALLQHDDADQRNSDQEWTTNNKISMATRSAWLGPRRDYLRRALCRRFVRCWLQATGMRPRSA